MSGATLTPKPGTVAFRALAHLETLQAGAELSTGLFAEAIGVPPGSLQVCLTPALEAGLLFRRQKDRAHARSPYFWSLVRHDAAPAPVVPPPGPQKPMAKTVRLPVPATPAVVRAVAPSVPLGEAPAPAAPTAPGAPRIALWNDFTLEVTRANGDMVRFTRQETAALWQYLGLFAEGA